MQKQYAENTKKVPSIPISEYAIKGKVIETKIELV